MLSNKRVDIDKLKSKKREIQQEYNEQVDQLRKEMEKRLEKEKRELRDRMNRELLEIEKEEERKYEFKVQSMRRQMQEQATSTNIDSEI
mmetsp:Transcript_16181/g.11400  ORF Transcript_16181/g.11400 Transcript_16181/m.11400 type:complete len:89 (+) Transcript_16181:662-928(+)|eukprot:CAMPEP_0116878282 /NCGR_PEP_ID=MMETSP0463-20121206/10015_1 /TAXON_ID=181622 /ORGANISM="Strombidinopsis sp, Strain SopsisLIS2011" /LENGTH=88 /DNA_ID=CAMNT_0004526313 /DNA_START=779 /DNA_END=1045 /DNA_ORIENTATION=-